MEQIPFIAHESDMVRMERTNRRVWILCIILIISLIASNAGWIYYESQFETVETTIQDVEQETDGGGSNMFVGGNYGSTESENNNNTN